jgi:CDP-6-deoxy-D-xylo-4-hexulose-3-dehydrase
LGIFKASDRARQLVNQVLDMGRISYGPLSKQFEDEFSAMHGCKYGVVSNSGTSSLHVAVQAIKELYGLMNGYEVLVPAITFVATVNVLLHNGLRPVLVDVEPKYYGMDVNDAERKTTSRTVMMMPVHLFGMPCQMDALKIHAKEKGLFAIEDSCECMFVGFNGKPVGSWGDVGCFSTYVAHLMSTGVGGIATTNDPKVAAKMRSLVNHGRDGIYLSIDDDSVSSAKLKEVASKRFRFESIGHSFRITELEAALAVAQLEDKDAMLRARRENAGALSESLCEMEDTLQLPHVRPNAEHAYMMYPIVLRRGNKWALCNYLEERGIETREMLPLTNQPCYAGKWLEKDYPVAANINKNGFYVGCHQGLTTEDMVYVAENIRAFFGIEI